MYTKKKQEKVRWWLKKDSEDYAKKVLRLKSEGLWEKVFTGTFELRGQSIAGRHSQSGAVLEEQKFTWRIRKVYALVLSEITRKCTGSQKIKSICAQA